MFRRFWNWITGKKPEFTAPDDLIEIARDSMYYAKTQIARIERIKDKELDGYLVTVEATAVINGIACWYDKRWSSYVGGTCKDLKSGRVCITVAHYKGQPNRIHKPTLDHEMGHGWLFGKGIYGHDPRFDGSFDGWAESRRATGVSIDGRAPPPEPTHIDYVDGAGLHTHIDIVAAPVYAGADGGTANA